MTIWALSFDTDRTLWDLHEVQRSARATDPTRPDIRRKLGLDTKSLRDDP